MKKLALSQLLNKLPSNKKKLLNHPKFKVVLDYVLLSYSLPSSKGQQVTSQFLEGEILAKVMPDLKERDLVGDDDVDRLIIGLLNRLSEHNSTHKENAV